MQSGKTMRANDEVTADHIQFLEDHCSNLEAELEETKKERDGWKAIAMQMQSDRDCIISA